MRKNQMMSIKTILKFTIILLLISSISSPVSAQKKKKGVKNKAFEVFEKGEYFKAINLLDKAYDKEKNKKTKALIVYKIAECYRYINNTKKAEMFYKKSISRKYKDPIAVYYYAEALRGNEKYFEAEAQYKRYIEQVPDDERGVNGLNSLDTIKYWTENPSRYQIKNIKALNTKESEFSPFYAKDSYDIIYFTSARKGNGLAKVNGITGTGFTNIYESRFTRKGEWTEPILISDTINSEFDDGVASLTKDGNTMFFSRCAIDKTKDMGCQIYVSTKAAGDDWEIVELLQITDDSISCGHPAISADGLALYFASTMSGGFGGTDIWKMERSTKGSEWDEPVNLGSEVNTPGNESFPFIREDGVLFFSSDTHLGMGGLDVFKAIKSEEEIYSIENMKVPINSSADDFSIMFQGAEEKGMFTSTRKKGGRGGDDIYSFELPPILYSLSGVVKDARTDDPVEKAIVKIVSSDGEVIDIKTLDDGSFVHKLKPEVDYAFLVSLKGYLKGKEKFSTKGLTDSKEFTYDISLAPLEKSIELPNILYDLGKWNLRGESKEALDILIVTLNTNPNITIELSSHTDFRGDSRANNQLSQKRAQSVVDYLIEKGIAPDRLTAKGYGESKPNIISKKIAKISMFNESDVLSEEFINTLEKEEEQEAAHQINRRTEFKVLSTKYIMTPEFMMKKE